MSVYIGTSGWWYDHWHKNGIFYPAKLPKYKRLEHYASQLKAVEVNSTFYEIPPIKRVENWVKRTPDNFRFVFKVPKALSHNRRIDEETLDAFSMVYHTGDPKTVGVLLQLPPSRKPEYGWLSDLLQRLVSRNVAPIAIEFRNEGWFEQDLVDRILGSFYENAMIVSAFNHQGRWYYAPTDEMVYLRFHGTKADAAGSYDTVFMERLIKELPDDVHTMFAFFNNDADGIAPNDAIRFGQIWDESGRKALKIPEGYNLAE